MILFCARRCLFRKEIFQIKLYKLNTINFSRAAPCSKCVLNFTVKPNHILNRCLVTNYILSSEIDKKSVSKDLSQLISILVEEANSEYSIGIDNLMKAVDLLDNHDVNLEDSVFLIKCCGDLTLSEKAEVKLELARKIMKILVDKSMIELEHYHAILDVFKENDFNVSADEFLSIIPKHITPSIITYEKLLHCVCNCGDISQATTIIAKMKKLNYPISENIFNALITGHGHAGDMVNARAVVDTMLTTQIIPTESTYLALLKGAAGSTEPYQILQILREAEAKQIKFRTKGIFDVVSRLALSGHDKYIPNILLSLPYTPVAARVRSFCIRLVHKGASRAALTVLYELIKPEKSPIIDADTYGSFLIKEMILADTDIQTIIDVCDSLMSSGRNMYALHVAYYSAVQHRSPGALPLIHAMSIQGIELRPHYFWPLIISINEHSGETGVMGVLKTMQNFKVSPDLETFNDYIFPQLDFTDPVLMIRKLQDLGFTLTELLEPAVVYLLGKGQMTKTKELVHSFDKTAISGKVVMKPLVKCFLKFNASAVDAISVLKALKTETNMTSIDESNTKLYNDWAGQFILEIIATNPNNLFSKSLLSLLKCYKSSGLKISGFAADITADYFTKNNENLKIGNLELLLNELRSAELALPSTELFNQFIPHPRDMGLEALENHLAELKSKRANTRGVLRLLLQGYCRIGNWTRAKQIIAECEMNKIRFSSGMLACAFDLHVKTKNKQKAQKALRDLRNQAPWFVIDEHKMIDYATFLICEGDIDEAIAVLKQHCADNKVKGGEQISHNCWRLLSALAETGTAKQTREALDELVELKFCVKNNTMLGPIVRAYLNQNDFEGAVNEYKTCAEEFNSTPLQLELMIMLAKRNETDLLQVVMDSTKKVHGTVNATTTLVIALASANKRPELRRLLTDYPTRISPIFLRQRCERLEVEGNAQPMVVLAQVCKDLPNFIPDDMYERILRIHCRKNDCEAAVELYNSMLENDQKPSTEFLYSFATFLKANGHALPAGIVKIHESLKDKPHG